jgi:hypothetical protein
VNRIKEAIKIEARELWDGGGRNLAHMTVILTVGATVIGLAGGAVYGAGLLILELLRSL